MIVKFVKLEIVDIFNCFLRKKIHVLSMVLKLILLAKKTNFHIFFLGLTKDDMYPRQLFFFTAKLFQLSYFFLEPITLPEKLLSSEEAESEKQILTRKPIFLIKYLVFILNLLATQ